MAASKACAVSLGLDVDSTEVIAAGYSVRVLLRPAQVVTRVVTEGQVLRGQPLPWLRREVAVAGFLTGRGAAVVPPWPSPGPHRVNGLDVTLWQWREAQSGEVSQEEFGRLLFDLHGHLASFAEPLPVLIGPLTDIPRAVELSDDPVLRRAAQQLVPEALTWPRRPLHGDAHTGNLLNTRQGSLWLDFEDACVGPLEWDFASRTITDDAIAAYPGEVDRVLLQRCRQLRRAQILASIVTAEPDPETELLRQELVEELSAELA